MHYVKTSHKGPEWFFVIEHEDTCEDRIIHDNGEEIYQGKTCLIGTLERHFDVIELLPGAWDRPPGRYPIDVGLRFIEPEDEIPDDSPSFKLEWDNRPTRT